MNRRVMFNRGTPPQKTLGDFRPQEIADELSAMFNAAGNWAALDPKSIKVSTFGGELQIDIEVSYDLFFQTARYEKGVNTVQTIPMGNKDMFIFKPIHGFFRYVAFRDRHAMKMDVGDIPEPNFE